MAASQPVDLPEYIRMTAVYHGIRRDWGQFFQRYPVMLAPVFTEISVPRAYDIVGPDEHRKVGRAMRMCTASSLAEAKIDKVHISFSLTLQGTVTVPGVSVSIARAIGASPGAGFLPKKNLRVATISEKYPKGTIVSGAKLRFEG
jgi:hypothetical protein